MFSTSWSIIVLSLATFSTSWSVKVVLVPVSPGLEPDPTIMVQCIASVGNQRPCYVVALAGASQPPA